MIQVTGNYFLKVSFGKSDVNIDTQSITELTVIQDISKYLPEFRLQLMDPQGILTHFTPFDKGMSKVSLQVGKNIEDTKHYNDFDFCAVRHMPEGMYDSAALYDVRGFGNTEKLFAPDFCRSYSGTIRSTLESIAINELGCDDVQISKSLDYKKTLIWPNWTNSEFFNYMKMWLEGKNGEGAYQIFIKRKNGKNIFVCMTLEDLMKQPISEDFVVSEVPAEGHNPIHEYEIMDNYKLFGLFGSRQQKYTYYDYDTATFVSASKDIADVYNLSDYYLVDKDDLIDSDTLQLTGRTTDFTDTFSGRVLSNYSNRINGLVKMWATTWGLPNLCQGDIVKVIFSHGQQYGSLQSCQFSGFWMVERVVHSFGDTHSTRMLLTRGGVDTDRDTTLVPAQNRKKS